MKRKHFLRYVGGKFYMLEEIIKRLDYNCKTYIELFAGSSTVFFNKKPHKVEILNDLNDDLINLYKIVQCNFKDFLNNLEEFCYSSSIKQQLEIKYKNKEYKNDIERAVWYYYLQNLRFSGYGGFRYSFTSNVAKQFFNKIKDLNFITERLQNAQILNYDYKKLLETIRERDNSSINIYVDPPYFGTEYYYKGNFNLDEHKILAEHLNSLQSKIIISYYFFDGIYELYPKTKWQYLCFEKKKYSQRLLNKQRSMAQELLLMNYYNDNLFK